MSDNTNYWDHPEPPKDFFERVEEQFDQYMFFENLDNSKRRYTCTGCHQTFVKDPLEERRTVKPEDVDFWKACVNETVICPKCGKKATLKNLKSLKNIPFQLKCNLAVLVDDPNDVWLVGYVSRKRDVKGTVEHNEMMFYHLVPGDSYQFKRSELGGLCLRQKIIEEPFTWHHGLWTEKYDYFVDLCGNDLEKTFLKYAFYDQKDCYTSKRVFYFNDVKFLCWFARHPQFEFLVKLGHAEIVHDILLNHTDFPSLFDWNAKKPWELFRISHEEYKIWKEYNLDFSLYKVFRRLKVPGRNGFELAVEISDMVKGSSWRPKLDLIYKFISKCKKVKTTPREIVNYIKKVQSNSGGACWHCPGITLYQAYTTWCDYIDLADGAGKLKTVNSMPKDLQTAHNQMMKAKKLHVSADWKKQYKKCFAEGEAYSVKYNKKFPRIEKIYKKITDKYSYENEKYSVIVPQSLQEIYAECAFLRLCVVREGVTRYWERISRDESYILFLRDKQMPDKPFYLLEVEPGGTIRQKRSFDDLQYEDIQSGDAVEFLKEWQNVVRDRLSALDRKLAKKSKVQREKDMQELRKEKIKVRSGYLTGQLLADVLSADLLEIDIEDDCDDPACENIKEA